MKNQSTKQLLILTAVLVAILVGLHFLAFYFIRGAGRTVSSLEQEVTQLEAQIAEFAKISPAELQAMAKSVSSYFVSKDGIVAFIQNIEQTGRANNLEISIRAVNEEKRSDDPNDDKELVRLKLEARGTWANNMKLINYLEHLPYKVTIHEASLSSIGPVAQQTEGQTVVVPTAQPVWRAQIELTAVKFK